MSVPRIGSKYIIRYTNSETVYKIKEVDVIANIVYYESPNGAVHSWPLGDWNSTFDQYTELPKGFDQQFFGGFKCECGVDTLGAGLHSSYCPKHGVEG